MTPSSENREECIVFIFHAQWATRTLLPRKPTGKPLSQTCVASENGFEARLVFDEAISTPQRAFERRVDRHMTLRGWQSARFTLTPIRPRPWCEPAALVRAPTSQARQPCDSRSRRRRHTRRRPVQTPRAHAPLAPRVTRSSHAKRVRQASWTRSLRTLGPWMRTWRLGRRTSALVRRASWSVGRPTAAAQSWSLPRRRSPHPRAQLPRRASSPPRRWSSAARGCRAALRLRSWRR